MCHYLTSTKGLGPPIYCGPRGVQGWRKFNFFFHLSHDPVRPPHITYTDQRKASGLLLLTAAQEEYRAGGSFNFFSQSSHDPVRPPLLRFSHYYRRLKRSTGLAGVLFFSLQSNDPVRPLPLSPRVTPLDYRSRVAGRKFIFFFPAP
jgi:hypothetical protein